MHFVFDVFIKISQVGQMRIIFSNIKLVISNNRFKFYTNFIAKKKLPSPLAM